MVKKGLGWVGRWGSRISKITTNTATAIEASVTRCKIRTSPRPELLLLCLVVGLDQRQAGGSSFAKPSPKFVTISPNLTAVHQCFTECCNKTKVNMLKTRAVSQSGKKVHGQLFTRMIKAERDTNESAKIQLQTLKLKHSPSLCQ